jgi:hypothetical protein
MPKTYPCKKRSPGSTSKGYVWNSVDDIVYVDEADLMDLLTSSHGEIYEVKEDVNTISEDTIVEEVAEVKAASEVIPTNDLSEATDAANVTKAPAKPRTRKTTKQSE